MPYLYFDRLTSKAISYKIRKPYEVDVEFWYSTEEKIDYEIKPHVKVQTSEGYLPQVK